MKLCPRISLIELFNFDLDTLMKNENNTIFREVLLLVKCGNYCFNTIHNTIIHQNEHY